MGMGSSVLTDVPCPNPRLQGSVGDTPPGTTSCILCEFIPRPIPMFGSNSRRASEGSRGKRNGCMSFFAAGSPGWVSEE